MVLETKDNISIGDTIKSLRDHKLYTVIGYSLEYHIVTSEVDDRLHAVKKELAVLLKG